MRPLMPDTYEFTEIGPVKDLAAAEHCILCRYIISVASSVGISYILEANRKLAICQTARNVPHQAYLDGTKHVIFSHDERRQNQAYCCHSYCWGYVKAYVKAKEEKHVTSKRLLRFAESSTHLFCLPGSADSGSTNAMTDVAPKSRLSDNQFKDLLKRFKEKLPPELQRMILDYAGTCPASSILHIVYAGIVDLLQQVDLAPNWNIRCPIARYMEFNFVFIEDSWLWCGCTTAIDVFGYPGLKSIRAKIPSDVNIVKFTVGRFGIQGLQFRGPSGASILIGEFQESLWTGEMTSSDSLQYLLLGLDGLKVRNLKINNRQKSFGDQFMWEREKPLSTTVAVNSKAYYRNKSSPSAKHEVNGFPGWHLIRYLPLLKHRSVFYGITAYCAPKGAIVGLESHFRCEGVASSSSIGRKIGCAIYFALADSEYFDAAWALCDDIGCFFGPFLVLHTNRDRIACFRPFMIPGLTTKLLHRGKISGIYCNALQECSGRLESFGLLYDPNATIINPSQPIIPKTQEYAYHLAAPPSGLFASRVVVRDVSMIQACYRGDRCTGMTLTLTDDRVEVLGQWFECTGHHELLFDMTRDRVFTGLRFALYGPPHSAVVRKVTLLTTEMSMNYAGDLVRDASSYDTIVWIYSALSDEISIGRE